MNKNNQHHLILSPLHWQLDHALKFYITKSQTQATWLIDTHYKIHQYPHDLIPSLSLSLAVELHVKSPSYAVTEAFLTVYLLEW